MNPPDREAILSEFRKISGVGPATAEDLWSLGFRSAEELKGQDPEAMFQALCSLAGGQVDRCMLYVFRCAVYFVTEQEHEPELLKWWSWKDKD
ncbi:MAG: helix-hairpin-helix domain-containing protein [Candidatus Glassbacteria bacterium]|nr:helix-hairpin-helix domain-containing protein [Candidatus Glassbacteria bacterium]